MKYIIIATQLCEWNNNPNPNDIYQRVFYLKGYNTESKRLEFDSRAKFALKLDSYEEAIDMLNFERNCVIQRFLEKTKIQSCLYHSTVDYLKKLDAKMKYEIICVED